MVNGLRAESGDRILAAAALSDKSALIVVQRDGTVGEDEIFGSLKPDRAY
ncbi:hypothetical protein [Microcoleus sp. bin38.metabat.b11b12b14.051]|nr:hypothetical protein [Microcoleus sp. bin38.metabat.b11b12b14.051]